jgi:hypothetical protein
MRRLLPLLMAGNVLFAQTSPGVEREGAYWVETMRASLTAGSVRQLHLTTVGAVTLRGSSEPKVSYTVRKRVRARSGADAARLLGQVRVSWKVLRDTGQLVVSQPLNHPAYVDIEVNVPRVLRQTAVLTRGGNISVVDLENALEAESAAGLIDLDRIGGATVAKTGGGEIRIGSVGSSLKCISAGGSIRAQRVGGEAWLETAGGEIEVADSDGPVHASTNGGNIRVERAGANVTASTAAGRIEVQQARGTVQAANSAGSIEVGSAQGVRCEASGGAIRLRNASGNLRAATDVGNILAVLMAGVPFKDSLLSTGAGDVTVLIPANLALTVKAQNEGGRSARIISEFPEFSPRHLANVPVTEGSLNGGGPVLTISAAGTIYLRRR